MNNVFKNWSADLIPVQITKDENGNKDVKPKPWKDGQVYKKFDKNSIALRTGQGSVNVIDVDTKDLNLIPEPLGSWLDDKLTFGGTLVVESKNGYHFYFDASSFVLRTTTKTGANSSVVPYVDFRGEGGLIFIDSNSDVASYKVIYDDTPTDDISEIKHLLPEYNEVRVVEPEDVGFTNLDDKDDKSVKKAGKMNLDEVKIHLNNVSSDCSRDEWLQTMASAYNLMDEKPQQLKPILKQWSQDGASEEHPYSDAAFDNAWDEINSGRFGKAFKGGTLVNASNEKKTKDKLAEVRSNLVIVEKLEKLEELAKVVQSTKMSHDAREEFIESFSAKCKEITNKPERVKWKKMLKFIDHEKAKARQEEAKNGMPDYTHTEKGVKYLNTFANLKFFVDNLSEHSFVYDPILKRVIVDDDYTLDSKLTVSYSKLSDELTRLGVPQAILASHFEAVTIDAQHNGLIKYIEELPEWDGETDYISMVADTLTTSSATKEYKRAVIESFVIQAVAAWDGKERTPHRLSRLESVLTFVGKQGGGKTTWVGELMPDFMGYYFKDGVELDPSNKDSLIEATSAGLVELGELDATTRKSDIASLKAFLSNTQDEFRAPYGRFSERYLRQTVFVGTVNTPDFLKDATGSRRFMVLDVVDVKLPPKNVVEGLWSQAFQLYLNGADWRLSETHSKHRDRVNNGFTDVGVVGDVAEEFAKAVSSAKGVKIRMTITKIAKELDLKLSARERSDFASALLRHDLERNAEGKYYLPVDVFTEYKLNENMVDFDDLTIEDL